MTWSAGELWVSFNRRMRGVRSQRGIILGTIVSVERR